MELQEAKQAVMEATKKLVASHLVARTWGNISCRVEPDQFLITPSGKSYDQLTEDQLVLVSQNDLSYTGPVKPSSEKGIHASIYRSKTHVNCVIHTHQEMASLISLLGQDLFIPDDWNEILGNTIHTAQYGLPGTKALQRHISKVLLQGTSSAVLMANHGTLCFGSSPQVAFSVAEELEHICQNQVFTRSSLLQSLQGTSKTKFLAKKIDNQTIHYADDLPPWLQTLCKQLLTSKTDSRYLCMHTSQEVLEVAETFTTLKAYLDDFAQIAGPSLQVMKQNPPLSKALHLAKHRDALLLQGGGALCMGINEAEAHSVATLVQKNSKAALLSLAAPRVKALPYLDAHLMRYVYKKKYAKLAQ